MHFCIFSLKISPTCLRGRLVQQSPQETAFVLWQCSCIIKQGVFTFYCSLLDNKRHPTRFTYCTLYKYREVTIKTRLVKHWYWKYIPNINAVMLELTGSLKVPVWQMEQCMCYSMDGGFVYLLEPVVSVHCKGNWKLRHVVPLPPFMNISLHKYKDGLLLLFKCLF